MSCFPRGLKRSHENVRGSVLIRLDAKQQNPYARTGFCDPNLLAWARANRAQLVGVVLILVQHWIAEGQPAGREILGSFEGWTAVVGGILGAAGIPGFLGNQQTFRSSADSEGEE